MGNYITSIKVNKIFHLENFEIPLGDSEMKHLIITGKNGSGKTILINAIADFLNVIQNDKNLSFLSIDDNILSWKNSIEYYTRENNINQIQSLRNSIEYLEAQKANVYGKVELNFDDIYKLSEAYHAGDFLFAFYAAARMPAMIEPQNPMKPQLRSQHNIKQTFSNQFLNFLSDLKVQEALARNEHETEDADKIKEWFDNFEVLLKNIFSDDSLKLKFEYKDYTFHILTEGKDFKFIELSDGYAAIIEIIADLILKMQGKGSLSRKYNKAGIVIIDELETHLHLELQRHVLPMLTSVFPNIQFIVTTHSPFILNSLDNVVAFDLQRKQPVESLTDYSYESLSEGYFGVSLESSFMRKQLQRYKELCEMSSLSASEQIEKDNLKREFEKISELVAPTIVDDFKKYNLMMQ